MAFVVEDGTGLDNSNSYNTVAELDAYWADRGEALTGFDTAQKQVALILATDYIESRYRSRFRGQREVKGQSLSFPRLGLRDEDGQLVEGIPDRLKFATSEYAKRALSNTLAPDPTIDASGQTLTKDLQKVGPIVTDKQFVGGPPAIYKPYPSADNYLQEYITSGGNVLRA